MDWELVGNWWHGPNGERLRAIAGADGGSGSQPQVVQNTGDPQLSELNKYTTSQIIGTAGRYGDLPGLIAPQPYMFTDFGRGGGGFPSYNFPQNPSTTGQWYGGGQQQPGSPNIAPGNYAGATPGSYATPPDPTTLWGGTGMWGAQPSLAPPPGTSYPGYVAPTDANGMPLPPPNGMSVGPLNPWVYPGGSPTGPFGPETSALNSLKSFYSRDPLDPYTAASIARMDQASNPQAMTIAARDIFNTIAAPSIRNNATVGGMGRSGAVNENLTNAGVQMALPIAQQSNQLGMDFGKTLNLIGQLLQGREQGNLQNLYTLAAQPRMEQASAESAGRNDILSMLARFPMASGAGTSTTTGIPGMPDTQGAQMASAAISSLMSIAMMVAMACHVAHALWAETDPMRFLCAFYRVNLVEHGWLGRQMFKLYRRFGKRLARSRFALAVLRPVFERVAQSGARKLGVTL